MAKKEWDCFVDDLSDLPQGVEMELFVRDITTYETHRVRAIVTSSRGVVDTDPLWLRYQRGGLRPEPWAIRVIQVYETLF